MISKGSGRWRATDVDGARAEGVGGRGASGVLGASPSMRARDEDGMGPGVIRNSSASPPSSLLGLVFCFVNFDKFAKFRREFYQFSNFSYKNPVVAKYVHTYSPLLLCVLVLDIMLVSAVS